MTRRQQQAEQTKQRLLEAAYTIVREHGIQSLSANRIIEVAGVSKGGFFHHFPQIEDLYLHMLDSMMHQLDEDLAPAKFDSFHDYIRTSTDYMIHLLDETPETITILFHFLGQSRHNEAYRQRLRTIIETAIANWARQIAGYFDPPLSEERLQAVIRLTDIYFNGFSLHYLVLGDRQTYARLSDDFADAIIALVNTWNTPGAA